MVCKDLVRSFCGPLCVLLLLISSLTQAQKYPDRPIRYLVTDQPGSSIDVLGRIIAERLATELNQSIIVDNRPGAGGNIGADIASKAPLMVTPLSNLQLLI